MRRIRAISAATLLVAWAVQPVQAQQAVLSAAGYTGLSVTPTAQLLPWGKVSLAYDNQVVGGPLRGRYGTDGHNFSAGFGLLPNLEVTGRLAASTLNTNCYAEDCGVRDLSFNFKAGIALDAAKRWHAAVGATDLGGQASYFRSTYGVLTYSPDQFDLSLGYARRHSPRANGAAAPLNGVFGSAAYRPWQWLQTHVEYTDGNAWAGARVFAPAEWLPAGWSAHVGANVRLTGDARTARSWLSAGMAVPLYKVPSVKTVASEPGRTAQTAEFSADGLAVSAQQLLPMAPQGKKDTSIAAATAQPATPQPVIAQPVSAQPVSDQQLRTLAEALRAKGFEDIAVGRLPGGAVAIKINNATYNVNTVDGLGVALGVVARQLADARAGYSLVLTQRQLAIVGVTGQADCLAQWIAMGPAQCTAGQLYAPGTTALDALVSPARWVVEGVAPSWATTRLVLQPVLRSALATEYGVFDYSVGVRATLQQPLWRGAYAEVSHVAPVVASPDFRQGAVFGGSRVVNVTDRALLHQVVRLPLQRLLGQDAASQGTTRWGVNAVTAHLAAGKIDANYRGAYAELRWEPGEGRHRFGVEGGRFERSTDYDPVLPIHSRSVLASYRYAYTPTRTYFEVTGGQFMYNDTGIKVGIKQWFDDVAVSLYLRRSKFAWERSARSFAGIEISIPLTPRKDMTPTHHLQVTGSPRWSYGVETVIRQTSNFITTSQGVMPGAAVLDRTFNSDRAGLVYFEDNMPRIRSAARQ